MPANQRPRVAFAKVPITECARLGRFGVHDELHARILYVVDESGPAAVISLDHMGLSPRQSAVLKARLSERTRVPRERTVLFYTHTHAGADFRTGPLAERLADALASCRESAGAAELAFVRAAVGRRYSVNRRALVGHGLGAITIIFNRNVRVDPAHSTEDAAPQIRDFIATGRNIWSPRYLEGGEESPPRSRLSREQAALLAAIPEEFPLRGPIDDHLEWLAFRSRAGKPLGSIVRFSAHPVIWRKSITGLISSDYPGVLCAALEQAHGGAPALFVNGPCGDVKPLYRENTETEMLRVGNGLARPLLRRRESLRWEPLERFGSARHAERFRVHPDVEEHAASWPLEEAAARRAELVRRRADPVAVKRALDWELRCWGNDDVGWRRRSISLPFRLLTFNDVGLLGLPTEVWCRIGLDVKAAHAGKSLIVGSLCDVATNYVPVPGALQHGGYEAMNSMLEERAGGRFVEVGTDMVQALL